MTYEETIESFREAVSLGFSPKVVVKELEDSGEADPKALNELQSIVKYGA